MSQVNTSVKKSVTRRKKLITKKTLVGLVGGCYSTLAVALPQVTGNLGTGISITEVPKIELSEGLTGQLNITQADKKLPVKAADKLCEILKVLETAGASEDNYIKEPGNSFIHELANLLEILLLALTENREEYVEEKIRLSNEFKEILDIMSFQKITSKFCKKNFSAHL